MFTVRAHYNESANKCTSFFRRPNPNRVATRTWNITTHSRMARNPKKPKIQYLVTAKDAPPKLTVSILSLPNELLHQIAIHSPTLDTFLSLSAVNHRFNNLIRSLFTQERFVSSLFKIQTAGLEIGKPAELIFTFLRDACSELIDFTHDPTRAVENHNHIVKETYPELAADSDSNLLVGTVDFFTETSRGDWHIATFRSSSTLENRQEKRLRALFKPSSDEPASALYLSVVHFQYGRNVSSAEGYLYEKADDEFARCLGKYYRARTRLRGTPEFDGLGVGDAMLMDALLKCWPVTMLSPRSMCGYKPPPMLYLSQKNRWNGDATNQNSSSGELSERPQRKNIEDLDDVTPSVVLRYGGPHGCVLVSGVSSKRLH
ncbi:hypothetical protein BJ508DRAFT_340106 [Ascobolus immersus RN42]|uniref:F-box domain-containing protein n=1 Tax=Ascobolus immersus RN42 TaxID=1160509 RepID=A0A3N4HXV4_ASCIM|nr:hypothetical protein BJ508DRAFT_340106 [Ascobolus immersus RN42]